MPSIPILISISLQYRAADDGLLNWQAMKHSRWGRLIGLYTAGLQSWVASPD
ncbi:MAG: hypothetical protein U1B80_10210 [Anaerolineaceae bacterium]|nr:hypothetical protein [Anaerolineaceae bacterium]